MNIRSFLKPTVLKIMIFLILFLTSPIPHQELDGSIMKSVVYNKEYSTVSHVIMKNIKGYLYFQDVTKPETTEPIMQMPVSFDGKPINVFHALPLISPMLFIVLIIDYLLACLAAMLIAKYRRNREK